MNTDTINLVQQSFAQVRPNTVGAADLFYRRLFELDPYLRPLFTSDIGEQGVQLMDMIGVAVDGLDDLDALAPAVQDLGVRHRGYGVQPEHYDTVGEALLWTLEQGLGDAFTPEIQAAWAETYGLLASVMKDAAYE